MRFSNRKVVVTGASRGIGAAVAKAFLAEGACVVGTSTKAVKDDALSYCSQWIVADFTKIAEISRCASAVREAAPDILINNAGINKIAPFQDITVEDFLAIQQVNVLAPFMLCQAAIPAMKSRGWGRIVSLSSIWGKISKEHRASYSSSKFALDGLTLALAAEHSANGILANCIAPGFIDTELTRRVLGDAGIESLVQKVPIRRLGNPDEVARLILWLSSNDNSYVSGQNFSIDGGFSRV